jgi:hypothetical protein
MEIAQRKFRTGPRKLSLTERFWEKVVKTDGCWVWIGCKNHSGYGQLRVRKDRAELAHRLSIELYHGTPLPAGVCVLHKCDNPACVRPDHLFLGDRPTNSRDMIFKGRSQKGEAHSQSRLTDDAVREIRKLAGKVPTTALSKRFKVTRSCITAIVRRDAWAHVK